MDTMLFIGLFWGLPIWAGELIGSRKGRTGWAWGLVLGWIGVVIVALLPNESPQHAAITEKPKQVAETDAEVRLPELRKRQGELQS